MAGFFLPLPGFLPFFFPFFLPFWTLLTPGLLASAFAPRDVLVVASGALGEVGRVFEECFGNAAAVVVADETTYEVAGRAVEAQLRAKGRAVRPAVAGTRSR